MDYHARFKEVFVGLICHQIDEMNSGKWMQCAQIQGITQSYCSGAGLEGSEGQTGAKICDG